MPLESLFSLFQRSGKEEYSVSSSWINGVTYDRRNQQLTGHFKNGRNFTLPCDKATFNEFMDAPSKGRFWNQRFK